MDKDYYVGLIECRICAFDCY